MNILLVWTRVHGMKCVPVSVKNVPVSGLLRVCLALSEGVHGECACEWKYAYT